MINADTARMLIHNLNAVLKAQRDIFVQGQSLNGQDAAMKAYAKATRNCVAVISEQKLPREVEAKIAEMFSKCTRLQHQAFTKPLTGIVVDSDNLMIHYQRTIAYVQSLQTKQ